MVIYGVATFRFNEAVKRNLARFPADFMFRLSKEEWSGFQSLRSQIAILKTGRGQHRKYLPHVFTEHGALMVANILNSPRAVAMSVYVIRAFMKLAAAGKPGAAGNSPSRPLPLESGEFLHCREFLRRYERMPQVKKAELIEGVVYMGSPASVRHAKPDGIIQVWLSTYASRHPDTEALPNATVILDAENTVQPDALLRRLPEHGGLIRVNEAGYLAGPPELIVELAASSASIDLRDKRRACCRNGVREYLVWLVAEARLEWFCLEEDDYCHQSSDAQGVLHSRVFPGLQLPVAPLLAGDTATVLATLTGPEPLNTKPPETSVKSEDTCSKVGRPDKF